MTGAPETREPYGAHLPALHLLCHLGWEFLSISECQTLRSSTRDLILKPRLVQFLQRQHFEYKGEQHPLSPSGVDQITRELMAPSLGDGLIAANERFYRLLSQGMTITEFMPDGSKHHPTIALIDWQNPAENRLEVTEELMVISSHGTHHRRPDLVCYINGLPLVVFEAKRPTSGHEGKAMIEEGISQHLRNQRPDEIPALYAFAQVLLSISHLDGRYGTTLTPANGWSRWREEEFDGTRLARLKTRPLPLATLNAVFADKPPRLRTHFEKRWSQAMTVSPLDRLLESLLTPARLLELLRGFLLFDPKVGKIIARHQQFFGVRAVLARAHGMRMQAGSKPDRSEREGGVVWHTTGAGKRFSLLLLSKSLLLDPELADCRLIVVTERPDLKETLANNQSAGAASGSTLSPVKEGETRTAKSGRDLARRLVQGNERIIFAQTHTFATALKLPACRSHSPNLIVLVDDAYARHDDETATRIKKAFPQASCISLTGTPLPKDQKSTHRFGPILHTYTPKQAIEDEAVVPLFYEQRFQGPAFKEAASNRIERIAGDIARHFCETLKTPGLGLKGLLATASKRDAIAYHLALENTGLVSSAVILSPPESHEGSGEPDTALSPEAAHWWEQQRSDEERVLSEFRAAGAPDLLIVVDRLLSGVEAPRTAVLYIDKPLQGRQLIESVAQISRLHDAKRYGILIDYRGVLRSLDTNIDERPEADSLSPEAFDAPDLEGLYRDFSTEYRRLPALHQALWKTFERITNRQDIEQYRQLLMPRFATGPDSDCTEAHDTRQALREGFFDALTHFGLCLQTALVSRSFLEDSAFSDTTVRGYKDDLRFFSDLRQIARKDALETLDYGAYEEQIQRLVYQQVIGKEVREPLSVYQVNRPGQGDDPESWSEGKTRNETDLIRTRLRRTIEQDLAEDPYAQSVFTALLKQTIDEAETMAGQPLKQYALFRSFEDYVTQREIEGMPSALGDNAHARAYYGVFLMVLSESPPNETIAEPSLSVSSTYANEALYIDDAVRDAVAENSLNPQNIEAAIRKALLPRLFNRLGLENAKAVIEQVIHITRIDLSRRRS